MAESMIGVLLEEAGHVADPVDDTVVFHLFENTPVFSHDGGFRKKTRC
jgi:hypothetical protein